MYRFNDPITDAEHDLIISKFSDLCEIVSLDEYDPSAREDVLALFLHYTSAHFHREEMIMKREGYADLEIHQTSHAYMQDAFQRLLASLRPGNPNLRSDLCLMRELFLEHILTFDEAFGAWISTRHLSRRVVVPIGRALSSPRPHLTTRPHRRGDRQTLHRLRIQFSGGRGPRGQLQPRFFPPRPGRVRA